MTRSASPLEGKTTDWRAGCGRSARPVRREGGRATAPPYPYQRPITVNFSKCSRGIYPLAQATPPDAIDKTMVPLAGTRRRCQSYGESSRKRDRSRVPAGYGRTFSGR